MNEHNKRYGNGRMKTAYPKCMTLIDAIDCQSGCL
jgi:hypothetical protein